MKRYPNPLSALRAAVKIAGSQAKLAAICGVSQPAVWHWLHISKQISPDFVLRVEAATGVSRHDLHPEIYPRMEQAA